MHNAHAHRSHLLRTGIAVCVFLLIWIAVTWANKAGLNFVNPLLLPSPMDVIDAAVDSIRSGELQVDIGASLFRILAGFVIAAFAGIGLSLLVCMSKSAGFFIEPLFEILRPIPPLAFLPMLVLWFGIGELSKVTFIAYSAFFPIFTASVDGVKHVDKLLLRAGASLGANKKQMFRYVVLPAATPFIFTGLKLGLSLSFFVIVAAEFLGADSGLGYYINNARTYFSVSQMLLGAAIIGFFGYMVNLFLTMIETRLLGWRD
ncbi:ABC transporter permease [Sodalis sp. RH22]|uniref:ABC transporter permease n=1 Tax=unclassified Sodalis (in: enterobacteria) TaxID=2636512 RepID=UPI0039B6E837